MSEMRSMILEYLGARFSNKQKQRFLNGTVKKFLNLGYSKENMKVDKKKIQNTEYINLYIGNFQSAKRVITTYYDTPAMPVLPIQYKFGNLKNNYHINLVSTVLPLTLYFIFEIAILWFALVPMIQTGNPWKMFFSLVIGAILVLINTKIIHGIPKIHHFVRNTLSVIFMMDMCEKMTPAERKKTVFVFTDHGCENRNGENMLAAFIKEKKVTARIVHLDCIADLSMPVIYANSRVISKLEEQDKDFVLKNIEDLDYSHITNKDIFITNGEAINDGVKTVTEKNIQKEIDINKIELNFQSMQNSIIKEA